ESGEVRAWNMGYDWPRPSLLRSGGTVMADVPLFTGLDLQVSAHGEIRSDFPLDQLEQGAAGVWRARDRGGAGAAASGVSRCGGGVMADVPLFTGLDLQVSAHGEIRSDFPLDQLEQDAEGVWRARHRTGTGTSVIRISSGGAVLLQGQRTPLPGHR